MLPYSNYATVNTGESQYSFGGLDTNQQLADFAEWKGRYTNTANGTAANNKFAAEQAWIDRDFSLYLSNTAYQRAAQDMKAAGINPATLSGLASGGQPAQASAPSGARPSSAGQSSSIIGTILKAIGIVLLAGH